MSHEPTQTSELASDAERDELDEAYQAVEKMTRWNREIIHKLDCAYEDLEEFLVSVVNDSLIVDIKDRVGECKLLARVLLEELES